MKRFLITVVMVLAASGFMLSCDDIETRDSNNISETVSPDGNDGSINNTGDTHAGTAVTAMTAAEQKEFFKTYVSLGDSITQGCQGMNVEENRQYYSYPAQLARAMGTLFNQPLVEYPGIGMPNPEDAFRNGWYDTWSRTMSHMMKTSMYWYRVDRYDDQANLNNFGITGACIDDLLSYDGTKDSSNTTESIVLQMVGLINSFTASVVGLNPMKAKPALDQALDRDPTFVSLWIGNNDVMFASVIGNDSPVFMTDLDAWEEIWNIVVGKIKAKKSVRGVLLINLPDSTDIALMQPVNNRYCTISEGADIPAGSKVPFFVTRVSGAGDVTTPGQIETVQERILAINKIIRATAEQEGWALLDAYSILKNEKGSIYLTRADGTKSTISVSTDYAGGFFSLDGIHPSSTGYAIIANRAAKAINEKYGSSIPVIDEVDVWKKDSLCQDPFDPRESEPVAIGNMSYTFNTMGRIMDLLF